MRRLPALVALAFAVGLALVSARADPGGGDDETARGRAALRAKRWAEAEEAFRGVLRSDARNAAARLGLAEALLGAGQRSKGLALLRELADGGGTDADAGRVRALLKERDPEGTRLEKLVDDYVRALGKLAVEAGSADPAFARGALERMRRLRPALPDLSILEARLGLLPPGEPLFGGSDGKGWSWFDAPAWTVADGAIVGTATDVYAATRTVLAVAGDYDLRAEVRVLGGGKSAVFFLQGGWTTFRENVSLGMMGSGVLLMEGRAMGADADPPRGTPRKLRSPVDPEQWNLFELRFRKGTVTGYVNGEPAGSIVRAPRYASGHVALTVLLAKVAFRRIELVRH